MPIALMPNSVIDLFREFGVGYCMSVLGQAHANFDGVYNDVLNALRQDPDGAFFRAVFLRGGRPAVDPFDNLNARLGNAAHQMESAYNRQSRAADGNI